MGHPLKNQYKAVVITFSLLPLLTSCFPSSPQENTAKTTQSSRSEVETSELSPEEKLYSEWREASHRAGIYNITRGGFEYQSDLCKTLRSGGKPQIGTHPPQSPAQVLHDGWGVGQGPDATSTMKEKAKVAEEVAIPVLCPDQAHQIELAKAGDFDRGTYSRLAEGSYTIGTSGADDARVAEPGTYRIEGNIQDCYWERSDGHGNIIDNNFVTAATSLTVTIAESDGMFTNRGCSRGTNYWERID